MNVRIAVASSDGSTINEHFGRTPVFRIYSLTSDGHEFLELRSGKPPCQHHEHSNNALEAAAELISDCRGVIASQIGSGAIDVLLNRRIFAFTMSGTIDDALTVLRDNNRFKYSR